MTRFIKTGLLILGLSFFFTIISQAQTNLLNINDLSNVNIDNYSNEELSTFYQKALNNGLDDSEIYSLLEQRGLNQTEISKLKSRIQSISTSSGLISQSEFENLRKENEPRFDSLLGKIPTKQIQQDYSIFGSELFATNSLVFEPNLRIPAPPNYVLGPDDQLVISIYGYSEKKYDLRINELGEIYIPRVGPMVVSGLTLEQATDRIKNRLANTIYAAIRSGQTKVQVTLGKIRSIRVTVIGQAKKPGTYTVSSLTTLYNILYLCGGPTEMGSYRDIEVIRRNEKRKADLYDFLVYGSQKDNILLQEGDVVRIPYYKNRVTIAGNIKRDGKFEMLDGETFSNLLNYSGGFTDIAYRGTVSVTRVTDSVRTIIDLPFSQFSTFEIKGSDKFYVRKLQEAFGNRIYISGAVQRPGPYQLTEGITVDELINKAGGLLPDAYFQRALIYRYLPNNLPAVESVNLDSVFKFNKKIFLIKNDSLVINSVFKFRDHQLVSVEGKVRTPVKIIWRNNMTLRDALFEAGGITDAGDSTTIEISRRIVDADVEKINHVESKVIRVDLQNEAETDLALQPFDVIVVKEKPGYSTQRLVIIQGEVLSPGKYALERSASRITDVIARTGGFKASADSNSITIRRFNNNMINAEERKNIFQRLLNISQDSLEKEPTLRGEILKNYDLISVNLKNALDNPKGADNLILEDGDLLMVSRNSNLIKVSGEVYSPTLVTYRPNKNLKYYVEQAGNFMPKASKTGAFVIYPNGKIKSVKHFLFFKFYPPVIQRSEIFVPQKDKSNKSRIGAAEWAIIVSALAVVSNVVINLTK